VLDESPNESEIPAKRWIRRLKHPGVFLTYDDGPNPAVTPQLLDLLREFGASATFFVTGESLDHPEAASLLKRMLAEGHTIGNHGQIHSKEHDPEFEISRLRIENACGLRTRIFRAPHGLKSYVAAYTQKDRRVLGVHWTNHFEDWLPLDFAKVAEQIPQAVVPGSILLLHDGAAASAKYKDRTHALALTKMILTECRRRSIPLAGLSSVYPSLHQIRKRGPAQFSSIVANFQKFKQRFIALRDAYRRNV
jgi:peptidoglycan/xylan/chitin deacetylase (PgdA/CDA1 family)